MIQESGSCTNLFCYIFANSSWTQASVGEEQVPHSGICPQPRQRNNEADLDPTEIRRVVWVIGGSMVFPEIDIPWDLIRSLNLKY